jgi:hypothetical protein
MAINFLRDLLNPQQAPSTPMIGQSQAPQPPMMPQMGGNLQRMTGGATDPRLANIMQAIGGTPDTAAVQMPAQMSQPNGAPAPKKRRSFLDTVGGIADVIARVGGAEALYQPTLDAREDRAREVDLEGLRKQLVEQQITQGGQTIQAGEAELADTERSRLGTALGAIATNPDALALWPQIAAEAGIDPQRAAQIGGILQANPDAAETFARSLGWSPEASGGGSQAKELQVYALLNSENPELAQSYLQSIANPDSMTEYQRGQLGIALETLGLRQQETEFDQGIALEELDIKQDKAATGGADLTPKDRSSITQKLKMLPNVRSQYNRVRQLYDEMVEEGTLARGAVGGLLPGQIAGGKAEVFDRAVGSLRKSILSMTRVPGVGSMSDYETRLDEAALPSRWGSDEGRAEAINNIGSLIDNYERGYRDMLGTPPAAPARPAPRRSGAAPARPAAGRRSVSPAAAEARRRGLIQ